MAPWIFALGVSARADVVTEGLSSGGPVERPRGSQTVVVTDPATEGPVRLVMPSRTGDLVYVDGWKLGALPLETVLAEGLHTFRIDGPSGKQEIDIVVTPSGGRTIELDLTPPAPPPPEKAPKS